MQRATIVALPKAQTCSRAYGIDARDEPIATDSQSIAQAPWCPSKGDGAGAVVLRSAVCLRRGSVGEVTADVPE